MTCANQRPSPPEHRRWRTLGPLAFMAAWLVLIAFGLINNCGTADAQELRGVVVVPIEEVEFVRSDVDQLSAEHEQLVLDFRAHLEESDDIFRALSDGVKLNAQDLARIMSLYVDLMARVTALEQAPAPEPIEPVASVTVDLNGGGDVTNIIDAFALVERHGVIVVRGASVDAPSVYPERITSNDTSGATGVRLVAWPARSVLFYGVDTFGAGEGLTIEGFQITVPTAMQTDDGQHADNEAHGVYIRSDKVTVKNCIIYAMKYGISGTRKQPWPSDALIQNNHITGCNAGLYVFGSGWRIYDNMIANLVRLDGGFDADYMRVHGTDIHIKGNYLFGATEGGIGGSHTDGSQSMKNNGYYLHGMVFEENIVADFDQGVLLEGGNVAGTFRDIVIRNNIFIGGFPDSERGGAAGVLAKERIDGIEISNNLFQDHRYFGVRLSTEAVPSSITHNLFYDMREKAIQMGEGSQAIVIGNIILDGSHPAPYTLNLPSGTPFKMSDVFLPPHDDTGAGPHPQN